MKIQLQWDSNLPHSECKHRFQRQGNHSPGKVIILRQMFGNSLLSHRQGNIGKIQYGKNPPNSINTSYYFITHCHVHSLHLVHKVIFFFLTIAFYGASRTHDSLSNFKAQIFPRKHISEIMSILPLHYFSFTIILTFFWVKKEGAV